MMRAPALLLILATPIGAMAQLGPSPSLDDPRLQTLAYNPSRPARLVAFPGANLTVMLLPGDQIERVALSDGNAFDVKVTESNDSLNIVSRRPDASATLVVETRQRRYEFDVGMRGGLAAYLVRFVPDVLPPAMAMPPPPLPADAPTIPSRINQYRVSGEHALRPTTMSDDGKRTYIEWGESQSLPAVFGIGATGQEEVVDGYMRGGRFTIDRVYTELVFRIDKKLARARRLEARSAG